MRIKNRIPQQLFLETNSSGQTKKFAGFLAGEVLVARIKRKNALVLALAGDLGSGKTTFVQGFLRAAGIKKKITSPTFVLIKKYKICANSRSNSRKFASIYHIDCYRIKKSRELLDLGLKEILNNPENIVLIEWPERIKKILPKDLIWIKFKHGEKADKRTLEF
ncbi:MAG: tRNA threonylcarbamoyladenosine biosynthesis protein TsaE [Actinobacteria bacterium]|nr:tRNA threonylcarbamoyladenosine biosynthesis protein TsaE [Actinomycetota bacterium]